MGGSKKGVYIFAGIILSLFALTTAYFATSVIISFKKGPERAKQDFTRISENISSALFFDLNADGAREFQSKALNNNRIAALLISSGQNVIFAYPSVSPLIDTDEAGKPALKSSSPFIKIFGDALPSAPAANTVLTAAIYTLHPSDIYNPARLSFLIILSCTLSVFAVLIYLSAAAPQKEKEPQKQNVPEQPFFSESVHTGAPEKALISYSPDNAEPSDNFAATDNFAAAQNESLFERINHNEDKETPNEYGDKAQNTDFTEKAQKNSPQQDSFSDPMGLFSPLTGVGWESYMETRLDSELIRAASSEQDLALVLLRIQNIENNELMIKRTAAVLLDFFKFKDFVFEYKKDGFAGILLNVNLDQTMVLAETMYSQLKELLESENIRNKLAIGISTRSLRLLPGSRLITEADKALEKAFDETGMPIVAFRVNPDKYRQFVADSERQM
ncbi:diguanylate cyclase [Treponema sp. OMZ 840]|uniref:diguanylate cyclase domain-containing protein n=1 Tax=Treponema sp. OMZ 840 TaxID=244313 RepID=UPI003D9264EF